MPAVIFLLVWRIKNRGRVPASCKFTIMDAGIWMVTVVILFKAVKR